MTEENESTKDPIVIQGRPTGPGMAVAALFLVWILLIRPVVLPGLDDDSPKTGELCAASFFGLLGLILAYFMVDCFLIRELKIDGKNLSFKKEFSTGFSCQLEDIRAVRTFLRKGGERLQLEDHPTKRSALLHPLLYSHELVIETRKRNFRITSLTGMSRRKIRKIGAAMGSLWSLSDVELEDHLDIVRPGTDKV